MSRARLSNGITSQAIRTGMLQGKNAFDSSLQTSSEVTIFKSHLNPYLLKMWLHFQQICKDPPPPKPEEVVEHNKLNDRPQIRTEEDVLNAGGCRVRGAVYENGAVWHPSVLPYGEINCVTCKCKVSIAK